MKANGGKLLLQERFASLSPLPPPPPPPPPPPHLLLHFFSLIIFVISTSFLSLFLKEYVVYLFLN